MFRHQMCHLQGEFITLLSYVSTIAALVKINKIIKKNILNNFLNNFIN